MAVISPFWAVRIVYRAKSEDGSASFYEKLSFTVVSDASSAEAALKEGITRIYHHATATGTFTETRLIEASVRSIEELDDYLSGRLVVLESGEKR